MRRITLRFQPARPRLLIVANVDWFFVSHRLPIGVAANARGWEVHVAAAVSSAESVRTITDAGLTFHELPPMRGRTSLLGELRIAWAIDRALTSLRPRVTHLVTTKPVIYGGLSARLRRAPGVVSALPGLGVAFTERGIWAALRRQVLMAGFRAALRQRNGRVLFQNRENLELFVQKGAVAAGSAVIIPGSGVDLEVFQPSSPPPEPVVVVLSSRMLWDKGIAEFVAAAAQVRRNSPGTRFLLVGDTDQGNPRAIPREQLQAWRNEGHVEWLGFRSDMPAVLAAAHVACLPSYYGEGIPKSLIEAAACGLPLVTTDTPGCRDIGRHGVNAMLVVPRNVPALTDALATMVSDRALRSRLGSASRALAVQEFGLHAIIDQTLAIYETFIA